MTTRVTVWLGRVKASRVSTRGVKRDGLWAREHRRGVRGV